MRLTDSHQPSHVVPGTWTGERDDGNRRFDTIEYWQETAKLLERGKFAGIFSELTTSRTSQHEADSVVTSCGLVRLSCENRAFPNIRVVETHKYIAQDTYEGKIDASLRAGFQVSTAPGARPSALTIQLQIVGAKAGPSARSSYHGFCYHEPCVWGHVVDDLRAAVRTRSSLHDAGPPHEWTNCERRYL